MFTAQIDRPYFDAWLRRTRKQLAASGRLTQAATGLAATEGGGVDDWRLKLRTLLEGREIPSLDLLTRIDALLAGPGKPKPVAEFQGCLF